MRIVGAFAVAFMLSGAMATASYAMPIGPSEQGMSSAVTLVAQGCGPGFHRGPYGACRPLFSCPRGWHTGPYGKRCFRN
jgi:hypothetical protein